MEWTTEAKQALHMHVQKATSQPATSDAYQDLYSDLRAHVEEDHHQNDTDTISLHSLNLVLTNMGDNEFEEPKSHVDESKALITETSTTSHEGASRPLSTPPQSTLYKTEAKGDCLSMLGGLFTIILPIIALAMELGSMGSSTMFFDPIPTWAHVLLIALVPVSFILVRQFRKNIGEYENGDQRQLRYPKVVTTLFGFTLPIIAYYAILFLPVTPIAIYGCIILLGLLPLCPLFCLIGWFISGYKLNDILIATKNNSAKSWLKYGIITGLVCLTAVETPSYLRQKALSDAFSSNDEIQQQGIENIRRFGGEKTLLSYCYYANQRTRGFSGELSHSPAHWVYNHFFKQQNISSKQARQVYYLVTGKPFNAVKPPDHPRGEAFMDFRDWSWDEAHGGDQVAARTKGLSLHSSRMDMHIDDDTKLGYLEWIITFKNEQPTEKEARMQVALPHNAFVSKLTLWVNGEERPAAFSSVSKVKAAYKEIAVTQRRDPVLVNVSGADRIMLQCFPVPANGGLMKMKVGITFPLCLHQIESGNIHFPYIAEHNFSIPKELRHEIYAQANLQINAPNSTKESAKNVDTLQCSLKNAALKTERITWKDRTPGTTDTLWSKDPFYQGDTPFLIRTTTPKKTPPMRNVMVVVDSSANVRKWKPTIAKLLDMKQDNMQFYIVGTPDTPLKQYTSISEFEKAQFVGGIDNVPALRKAISLAKKHTKTPTSILWLHGAQPVKFPTLSGLEQDLERTLQTIPIHSVPLEDGANHILEAFKNSPSFKGGCRVVNATDLIHMVEKIQQPKHHQSYTWTRASEAPQTGTKVWDQLVRKWAHESTIQRLTLNDPTFVSSAHLPPNPATYQIVTPVSGAVVLESEAQYKQTGLENPTGANAPGIPAIPEPSSSLLILIGALITTMRRNRQIA